MKKSKIIFDIPFHSVYITIEANDNTHQPAKTMTTIGYTNERYFIVKDHSVNGVTKSEKKFTDYGYALKVLRRLQYMNKDMRAFYYVDFEYDKKITA